MYRRTFLAGALAAPGFLRAASERRYTWAEVEKMLSRGDVKGKLGRDDLPTPALLLDLDAFEHNVNKMAAHAKSHNRALRPHAKTHKCPEVAKALIRAGAVGACTAKLNEAEVFADHDIRGLLITTAVVGPYKIERAVRLAKKNRDTIFSVDNSQNVRDLNAAAAEAKLTLNLAIDLFITGRTGVLPGTPALNLAQLIESLPNVTLAGIQAYAGQASHVTGFEARRRKSEEVMAAAVDTRRVIERAGISCPLLTGGSTGTYNIDTQIEGITELQPGSFVFMDIDYRKIGGQNGEVYDDFKNALTVLTTVVSKPTDDLAIVDGGFKAFATDRSFGPEPKNGNGIVYAWGGDEHGRVNVAKASRGVNLGDRIEFLVPHCDPNVNLYDRMYCLRGEQVEAVWQIAARGMSQ
ncbi:MAG: DSD1 family PLP-dependent enzyme [Bryobacterales bacterium]|nr:DSD1 family PLP-dependent enzyme [Bryobacterales bacterium]